MGLGKRKITRTSVASTFECKGRKETVSAFFKKTFKELNEETTIILRQRRRSINVGWIESEEKSLKFKLCRSWSVLDSKKT